MNSRVSKRERPSIREYFLLMLTLVASRSTCTRRKVGAIIVDENNKVLATGYNGVPKNFPHCIDSPCAGATDTPGNNDNCMAVHAEQNALLQCVDIDRARIMYCSCIPCFACAKIIANTKISYVVCIEKYADTRGLAVLLQANIVVEAAGELFGSELEDDAQNASTS